MKQSSKIKRSDLSAASDSDLDKIYDVLRASKCFSDKFRELVLVEESRVNRGPEYIEALKALTTQSNALDFAASNESEYTIDEIADHIKDKITKYS